MTSDVEYNFQANESINNIFQNLYRAKSEENTLVIEKAFLTKKYKKKEQKDSGNISATINIQDCDAPLWKLTQNIQFRITTIEVTIVLKKNDDKGKKQAIDNQTVPYIKKQKIQGSDIDDFERDDDYSKYSDVKNNEKDKSNKYSTYQVHYHFFPSIHIILKKFILLV